MKKLFAVLLTLALVLAMGTTAFAAGTGTITIDNAVVGEDYTIYQMFSFEPIDENNGFYTVTDAWADFLANEGAAYLENDTANGTIAWVGEQTDARAAELAKAAVAYAKQNGITGTTITAESATVTFTNVPYGYYAIDTSLGTVCALTNVDNTFEAHEKNSGGSIIKEVKENTTNAWGETNDANIGETVEFRATITTGKGTSNYVMHDTMSEGLTFNADSVKVTFDGEELTTGADYVLVIGQNGYTFEIDFTDTFEAGLTDDDAGKAIYVEYSAVLNEKAVIAGEGNPNEVYLTYGNNQEATKDTTVTYTYQFQLVKTDATDVLLNGAEFKLYDAKEGGNEIAVVKVSDGVYRVAKADETGVVIEAGYVTIQGLDSATYYLEETKAPDGYNMLTERQAVTITAANNDATVTADGKYENGGVQVINRTGSLLPETGGIGTTIFYVVGGLLMVGAVIFLVTKKRMSAFA